MKALTTGRGAGVSDAKFAFQFGSPSTAKVVDAHHVVFGVIAEPLRQIVVQGHVDLFD
jgi:hypothetical protein